MNKNLILSLLAILLFTTCKKGKTTEIDAAGTYTLYATGGPSATLYSVETTPCLADNLLILRADGKSLAFYKGTSPCSPTPGVTIGSRDTTITNWQVKQGKFYFNNKQNGEVITVDGKLQITTRDTITLGGSGIIVRVFKKS